MLFSKETVLGMRFGRWKGLRQVESRGNSRCKGLGVGTSFTVLSQQSESPKAEVGVELRDVGWARQQGLLKSAGFIICM